MSNAKEEKPVPLSDAAKQKEKLRQLQAKNGQMMVKGRWRKDPFGKREYIHLDNYVVTDSVSNAEAASVLDQLNTPLDGYLGPAYNYDDCNLTEEWMTTFRNGRTTVSENDVVQTQLAGLMEVMLSQVQDRIYNEQQIMDKPPLVLGKDVVEVPVWGMDCYTRRMVELAIETNVPAKARSPLTIKAFIEQVLLSTINRQSPELAHDLSVSLQCIIDDEKSTARDRLFAQGVMTTFEELGFDAFKIHPKGTGVICINPDGIQPQVLVAEYLGELYPAYRWCERLDVIEQAQKYFELKPTLPDFYNILLERPRKDPRGYGLLFVDASQKANIGSSCSHSCAANCTSAIVARNGTLTIAMTTNRRVFYGEELTFDYYSITTSDVEWRAAVCLCGMTSCRGSFLSYSTQDDLQQVLNQNFGPVSRFASLLRACADRKPLPQDMAVLARHGIREAILGPNPPNWMIKYAADIIRFIEFERKALPCALLRSKPGDESMEYTFAGADMDARCVMEQRIQSLVCCYSSIHRVLRGQSAASQEQAHDKRPLVPIQARGVLNIIWERLCKVPGLLEKHLLHPRERNDETKAIRGKKAEAQELLRGIQALIPSVEQPPATMAALREVMLAVRQLLMAHDASLTYYAARLMQLADVLLLWTYTINLSTPQDFECVTGEDIVVPARELGGSVPTSVLTKAMKKDEEQQKKRRKASASASSASASGGDKMDVDEVDTSGLGLSPGLGKGRLSAVTQFSESDQNCSSVQSSSECEDYFTLDPEDIARDAAAATTATSTTTASDIATDADEDAKEAPAIVQAEAEPEVVEEEVEEVEEVTFEMSVPPPKQHTAADDDAQLMAVDDADDTAAVTDTAMTCDEVETAPDGSGSGSGANSPTQTPRTRSSYSAYSSSTKDAYLQPNDPVFRGHMSYDAHFIFWQLAGWFNAGSDQKLDAPDLFGCVELPDPVSCFGPSDGTYSLRVRQQLLLPLLKDEKQMAMHWPRALKNTFNLQAQAQLGVRVFGSPMLDAALGQIDSVSKVLQQLRSIEPSNMTTSKSKNSNSTSNNDSAASRKRKSGDLEPTPASSENDKNESNNSSNDKKGKNKKENNNNNTGNKKAKKEKKSGAKIIDDEDRQLDEVLAPEANTNWVQCDSCNKWRRVPWHVELEALPDPWDCSQNTWDLDTASCSAAQDTFDPHRESTVVCESEENKEATLEQFAVGSWWDVYCSRNEVYYEAQVRKQRPARMQKVKGKTKEVPAQVLVHFHNWSPKFDEWVDITSDRFQPHNLFTNPMASDPRQQELWQGRVPMTAKLLTR